VVYKAQTIKEEGCMKKLFMNIGIIFLVSALTAGVTAADLRSDLIGMKKADSVYTIDDYHTIVWAYNKVQDDGFDQEFLEICNKYGQLETSYIHTDSITGKTVKKWGPITLERKKSVMGQAYYGFIHPGSGEEVSFLSKGDEVLYRINNVFEMTGNSFVMVSISHISTGLSSGMQRRKNSTTKSKA
jgi:hypothetical protein